MEIYSMKIIDYIVSLKLVFPYLRKVLIDTSPNLLADYRLQLVNTDSNVVTANSDKYVVDKPYIIDTIEINRSFIKLDDLVEVGTEVIVNAKTWTDSVKDNYISITCNNKQSQPLMMEFTVKVCNS